MLWDMVILWDLGILCDMGILWNIGMLYDMGILWICVCCGHVYTVVHRYDVAMGIL